MIDPPLVINVIGDILSTYEELQGPKGDWRWPVVREGERDEIPLMTRQLVWLRDGGHCKTCRAVDQLQVDHVIPWSAGGPDTSDNLRMLCEKCNSQRSNYREMWLPRIVPVAVICDECLINHDEVVDPGREHGSDRFQLWRWCPICIAEPFSLSDDRVIAWCGTCRLTSRVSDPRRLR